MNPTQRTERVGKAHDTEPEIFLWVYGEFKMSAVSLLERIRDKAVEKMDQIILDFKEEFGDTAASGVIASGTEHESSHEEVSTADVAKMVAPAAIGTAPREGIPEDLKVSTEFSDRRGEKSQLIRNFINENPEAKNKDLIEHYRKKGIEIKPSLVSLVRKNMDKKEKKRGRPVESTSAKSTAGAKAEKKSGLTMVEAAVKACSKSKDGLKVDKMIEVVKKHYSYGGDQGDQGMENCLRQALYSLCQKKPRRGWKGTMPVLLHDKKNHTYRLNPRAERKTA